MTNIIINVPVPPDEVIERHTPSLNYCGKLTCGCEPPGGFGEYERWCKTRRDTDKITEQSYVCRHGIVFYFGMTPDRGVKQ